MCCFMRKSIAVRIVKWILGAEGLIENCYHLIEQYLTDGVFFFARNTTTKPTYQGEVWSIVLFSSTWQCST